MTAGLQQEVFSDNMLRQMH